jgi:hypothetical protein
MPGDDTNSDNLPPQQGGLADAYRMERLFLSLPPDEKENDSQGIRGYDVGEQALQALRDEYTKYLSSPVDDTKQNRSTWAINRLEVDELGDKTNNDPGYGPEVLDLAAGAWLNDHLGTLSLMSSVEALRNSSTDPVENELNNLMISRVENNPMFITRQNQYSQGGPGFAATEVNPTNVLSAGEGARSLARDRAAPKTDGGGITGWIEKHL